MTRAHETLAAYEAPAGYEALAERGMIAQQSNREAIQELLAKPGASVYVGFDPTASSLHVGHLLPIMALSHLQRAGHRPIVLVGGATGMVGDPSGRSEERNLLTAEQVAANATALKKQLSRFVSFDGPNAAIMADNHEWIGSMSFIDWLRDVGKHFTINVMQSKESVRRRISSFLVEPDILDWVGLCASLRDARRAGAKGPIARIAGMLDAEIAQAVEAATNLDQSNPSDRSDPSDRMALILTGLNDAIKRRDLYDAGAFAGVELPGEAKEYLAASRYALADSQVERLNRLLVEAVWPGQIARNQLNKEGLSYTEFSYMTMQAYDFLCLYDRYGCRLQGGGNDQWGNITAGIDLTRKLRGVEVFGLTFPLVTAGGGEKFGKSAGNAVWLDPTMTSPYNFYQYWVRTDDRDVEKYIKYFTFLDMAEIEQIVSEHAKAPGKRTAQRRLAAEITRIVHGQEELDKARQASEALFGGDIRGLSLQTLQEVFADVPSSQIPRERLAAGLRLSDLLRDTGLCASKGEARRAIAAGGVYVNNQKVQDVEATLSSADLLAGAILILRHGKKNYHLARFSD